MFKNKTSDLDQDVIDDSSALSAASPVPCPAMGRRKSKRNAPQKRKAIEPLDTNFNCPFCNHERSCEVKMVKATNTGRIQCNVCMEDYQVRVPTLRSIFRCSGDNFVS